MESKENVFAKLLLNWHKSNRREFPWRKTDDPYLIFISEFFLQRTPANRVAVIIPLFIKEFPTANELANANVKRIQQRYASLGLTKRLYWLTESMKIIVQKYNGRIPKEYSDLMSLPGVGNYTASAILTFAYKQRIPIIDTNVVRVLSRVFGFYILTEKVHVTANNTAINVLPKNNPTEYNMAILDFGALICKKRPLCLQCPLNEICDYFKNNR